jgi:hypothetical protein
LLQIYFFCTKAIDLQQAVDIILEQEQLLKTFFIKEENIKKEKSYDTN